MTDQPTSTVHRSVEVELPPGEVWELLVDDDERAQWFGGPTTLEPVPGGAGLFTDHDGTRRRARIDEVAPDRRLAWTWWPEDDGDAASQVEVDLHPVPGGTRVSVTEAPLTPTASASVRRPGVPALPLLALETTCLLRSWGRVLA